MGSENQYLCSPDTDFAYTLLVWSPETVLGRRSKGMAHRAPRERSLNL